MKTSGSFDPLSITHRVRTRLENKANGVSVPDVSPTPRHPNLPVSSTHTMNNNEHLKNQFMNLLLGEPLSADQAPSSSESAKEFEHISGTKQFFSPLNKQEYTKTDSPTQSTPFQFCVQNSALGELEVQGEWLNGRMQVSIKLAQALEPKERRLLGHILKMRLSRELGIDLEVYLD